MADKKKFATVNWLNMDTDAFLLMSSGQMAVNALASAEMAIDHAKNVLKAKSKGKKVSAEDADITEDVLKHLKEIKKSAEVKADNIATMFFVRYISTEDVINGEIFHFDMVEFLKKIGVLSDGEIDKKVTNKVTAIRDLVVDRKKDYNWKREKTDYKISKKEAKAIKNTKIELLLAIIMASIESGAIEYSEGGLAFVDFSKK